MALNNYIEDDWDDNALSGRTNPSKDVYYSITESGTGDLLKGVYRPRWRNVVPIFTSNSGNISAVNSELSLNTESAAATSSNVDVGSWKHDFRLSSSGNTTNIGARQIHQDDNNHVYTIARADGTNYKLYKKVSGSNFKIISATWPNDTSWHTHELTRSSYGEYELFFEATSKGTATDTFLPDVNQFRFYTVNIGADFDSLVIQ